MTHQPCPSDRRALLKVLRSWGWRVTQARSGHLRILDGDRLVTTMAATPSDWRSLRNTWADIKRHRKHARRCHQTNRGEP